MTEKNSDQFKDFGVKLINEVNKVLVGQETMVNRLLTGLLAGGHVLIEGMPGLAKTTAVKVLSDAVDTGFSRIQFTPDMLPADVIGTEIFNPKEGTYSIKKGPIFSNLVLADEINRAPAKVQAALLETMQERQVTIGGQTYQMDQPFMVLATQNPIEQEGTYPLPEAQLDRFMFNVLLDYPTYEQELQIVKQTTVSTDVTLSKIMTDEDILNYQKLITQLPLTNNVLEYAVGLVAKTRPDTEKSSDKVQQYISWGAGPRASQFMLLGAKCYSAINGKYSPDIEDVKAVAKPILRHRIVRNYKAEAEGISVDNIIDSIL